MGYSNIITILGNFGLELNSELTSGSSSGSIETFHTIRMTAGPTFDIDHVEVNTAQQEIIFLH